MIIFFPVSGYSVPAECFHKDRISTNANNHKDSNQIDQDRKCTDYSLSHISPSLLSSWRCTPAGPEHIFHLDYDFTFNQPLSFLYPIYLPSALAVSVATSYKYQLQKTYSRPQTAAHPEGSQVIANSEILSLQHGPIGSCFDTVFWNVTVLNLPWRVNAATLIFASFTHALILY